MDDLTDELAPVRGSIGFHVFLATLNLVLGLLAALGVVPALADFGLGWPTVAMGVAFAGCSALIYRGSLAAAAVAVGLWMAELLSQAHRGATGGAVVKLGVAIGLIVAARRLLDAHRVRDIQGPDPRHPFGAMVSRAWLIGIAGFVLAFAANYLFPRLTLGVAHATGSAWEPAREELRNAFAAELADPQFPFDLSAEAREEFVDCETDSALDLLNATSCDYAYVKGSTTQGHHLASQEACLAQADYPARVAAAALECFKLSRPTWASARRLLTVVYQQTLQDPDAVRCSVDRAIELYEESACPVLKSEATSFEDLVNYECPEVPDFDTKFRERVGSCQKPAR